MTIYFDYSDFVFVSATGKKYKIRDCQDIQEMKEFIDRKDQIKIG